MILFLVLLINIVIGHNDLKHEYLKFSENLQPIFIIFKKYLSPLKKYPLYIFFCVLIITTLLGYNYYKSIDPLMQEELYLLTYSSWLSTPAWFLIFFCIFIDLPFYYRQKKVISALKCENIEVAKNVMRQVSSAPLEDINDIYNELIIWITHNSLYRIFLPLFYYMLGDIPFLLGYYLLYPLFKQLTKVHDGIVYFPVILLAIIGTMLSILTGNLASIIDESWGAMRYCSKNEKLLRPTNVNYLSVVFMIATGCNLKYYDADANKYINSPLVKKISPESVKIDYWVIAMLLKERNIILPFYSLCLGFSVSLFY